MKGRLARSSLQTAVMLGLRVATQAGTLILLSRLLGPDQYGTYASVASLAVVLGTLPSLGTGYAMLSRATRDPAAIRDVWRYAWPLTLFLGTLLLGGYLIAARALVGETSISTGVLVWIGAAELLLAPYSLLLSFALQSQERVPLSQLVQWISLALRLLAALACAPLPESDRFQAFAMLQFVAALIGLLITWRIAIKYVSLDWRPRLASAQELKFGASYAAMFLVTANPSELDKMVSVRTLGAYEAGIYSASSRVMSALVMPVLAMLMSAQPRLFRHAGEPTTQNRRLIAMIALLAAGWGLLGGLLIWLGGPLLPLLFGPAYQGSAILAPWLALIPLPLSLRVASGSVLVALGRPLERIGFELGGIGLLLIAMLTLTRHHAAQGLVVAVAFSELAMCACGWWLVSRRLARP